MKKFRNGFAAALVSAVTILAADTALADQTSGATAEGQVCRSMGGIGNYNYVGDGLSGGAATASALGWERPVEAE